MAKDSSFDIVSKVEMPEVKNAITQALKEITQRYDFKGSKSEITLDEKSNNITIVSDDNFKLKSVIDIFQAKCIKREVSIKNFQFGKLEGASGGMARQVITIQQGISSEKAKEIVKLIKGEKIKVQASIQEDQLRVTGKKKDDLQAVIGLLNGKDLKVSLQYINFR